MRKRILESDEATEVVPALEDTEIVRKAKVQKAAPLAFTTKQDSSNKPVKLLYESDRGVQQASDQGATRSLETETETDRDARQVPLYFCQCAFAAIQLHEICH